MENIDEFPIHNMLSYRHYSVTDFLRVPLVIFFGDNSINIRDELKYQIVFHLLNSLFAFLFFAILTPITFGAFITFLVAHDNLCSHLKDMIVPFTVGAMTVFNVLFFIPGLPIIFGTIGLVSWILSGVFVVGLTIFNILIGEKYEPYHVGVYKDLSSRDNVIYFIEAKNNNLYRDEGSNIIESKYGDIGRAPVFGDVAQEKEIWLKVPVSEISFRKKIFLRDNEIMQWLN